MASRLAAETPRALSIPQLAWLIGAVLFAGLAASICLLTARLSHDEEQYVAAAVLASRLRPILDFAYLQTPLQPLLLAPIVAQAGAKAFLACRLISGALGWGACILAYPIVRNAGGGRPLAAFGVVWVASSTSVQEAMGSARNDALPLALTLAGAALLLRGASEARSPVRPPVLATAAAGVLFGAALCAKLTYVFAPVGGLLYLLTARRRPGYGASVLVFIGGAIVGLIPLLCDLFQAPRASLFDMVEFHRRITPQWYVLNGAQAQRMLGARLKFWLAAPLRDPVLLGAIGVLGWGVWSRRPALFRPALFMALLLVLAAGAAFVVNPPTLAYLAAPSALLILAAAVIWSQPTPRQERPGQLMGALVVLTCIVGDLQLARHALWLARPARWTPEQMGAQSRQLARLMTQAPPGPVATVSPIRVLGTGRGIYPEFAAGPFILRSGAAIGVQEAAVIKAATPDTLETLFARTPPAAILTGLETSWPIRADAALSAYARRHGFRATPALQGALLFIRPAGDAQPPRT